MVAVSGYRTEQVDNFNGGQYESVFEVPPDCYDLVTGEQPRSALTASASAVVGAEQFVGISVRVRRTPVPAGWDQQMLRDIVERHRSDRDRPHEPTPGGTMLAVVAVRVAEPAPEPVSDHDTQHPTEDAVVDDERPF